MALRRALVKRLFSEKRRDPVIPPMEPIPNLPKTHFHRELLTSPDSAPKGFFRRVLQRRAINQAARLPEILSVPVGDKLREKLRSINIPGDRLWINRLIPPANAPVAEEGFNGITVTDAKKILRSSYMEKIRGRLREIPANSISYAELVGICGGVCGGREQGVEFAKMLDDSGNVIVLGNFVFLRPDQVAKSMEKIICESIGLPNDPRRRELDQLEKQKAQIDKKAEALVKGELYCGLGYLVLQTLGFMRLTFWELSWDVMEPICFFVTSLHFAIAYAFFLRTSKEPSFEGYFQRRFKVKQAKLMTMHNFDLDRYNKLREAFYPLSYGRTTFEMPEFVSDRDGVAVLSQLRG